MSADSTDNQNPPTQGKKRGGCHGCLKGCLVAFSLVVVLIVGGVLANGDWRSDKSVLKKYQPSAELADIALKTTLTDKGRALLYRTDPRFVGGEEFRAICVADGIEGLACTNGRKTTFLQIDDPQFSDHKYSAAAHEMLHVAYSKLKTDEKTRLNLWIDQELAKHQDDTHLTGIINILKEKKASDPESIFNELHSKFGAEYPNLSPELETHYQLYFQDRSVAVGLYRNGGFNSRVRRLDQIDQEAKVLETKLTALNGKMQAYKKAEDFDSFNSLVGQYNGLVKQYNAKANESQKLYGEVQKFYRFFNPNFKPAEEKPE